MLRSSSKVKSIRLSFGVASALLAFNLCWAEDYIPPEKIQVSTPSYFPDHQHFNAGRGTYQYEVRWEGIPAAEATVDVDEVNDILKVRTTAKTYRGIDLFYSLRYEAEGLMNAFDLRPIRSFVKQRENSREKITEINFREGGVIEAHRILPGKNEENYRFMPQNMTLDPFSAAFLARSLDWRVGETKEFDTFNGKSRYLIELTANQRREIMVNGAPRPVLVISPRVKLLSCSDPSTKLRRADIYVTDDSDREILKLVSEVFIGSVTTKLVSFQPREPLGGARLAEDARQLGDKIVVR